MIVLKTCCVVSASESRLPQYFTAQSVTLTGKYVCGLLNGVSATAALDGRFRFFVDFILVGYQKNNRVLLHSRKSESVVKMSKLLAD